MHLFLSPELREHAATCLPVKDLRPRMEERFAWAVGQGLAVTALACELGGLSRLEREAAEVLPETLGHLARALQPAFQASEAFVQLEEGHLVALLIGSDPRGIEAACKKWIGTANTLRIEGRETPARLRPALGFGVTQPGKRLFLDTLIQVAREGLQVARCRGPGACVHTMLYDILQARLEEERGTEGFLVAEEARSSAANAPTRPDAPADELVPRPRATKETAADPDPAQAQMELREQELVEALDAERRENATLRTRLREQSPLTAEPPSGDVAEGPAPPTKDPRDERIDKLQRRLAKVTRSLEEAEDLLARTSNQGEADFGIPSLYRTIQGLDAKDPRHALKAALMKSIYDSNVELRARFRVLPKVALPKQA